MFGNRKKEQYVKLTKQEIQQFEKNMSKRELKEFQKRQKRARGDLMWDALMAAEFFDEDLFE